MTLFRLLRRRRLLLLIIITGLFAVIMIYALNAASCSASPQANKEDTEGMFNTTGGITDVMHISKGTVENVDSASFTVEVRADSDALFSPSSIVIVDYSRHESEVADEFEQLLPGSTRVEVRYFPIVLESGGYSGSTLEIIS
ncbi:hypothetical protein [Hugonella massiliensis]|uniref:hypothetical protein n=1 Tax=Hugonella massiliensis TaxID=1720315 RepID=UPI00073EEF35|nr:hypothetical protein [Hugonella massiliensis]